MSQNIVSQKPLNKKTVIRSIKRGEFIEFVSAQFKELVKKNLEVPIKLYQL